ncbi:uncharacterized protein AB9W97_004900 [Spinachia spinachia]
MEVRHTCMMGARHLSEIQEESNSREQSTCLLPPILQQQVGRAGKPGVNEAEGQEVRRLSDLPSLFEQQKKLEDNRTLLEELSRIEAKLRESVHPDIQQQREAVFLRRHDDLLSTHLCYLSLGQRVARPWVSSYFREFPMHIYCLPVQAANQRSRRRGLTKKR